jgi:tetratricopeptide (TPR) repeat protein
LLVHGDAARAAEHARWVADREPRAAGARLILADSLRTLAERAEPSWDLDLAGEALSQYEKVLLQDRGNLAVVNNVVWLRLKAFNMPDAALRAAEQLRAAEDAPTLAPSILETLGAVYVETGAPERGLRLLERAATASRPRASLCCQQARAYLRLKRRPEAAYCLQQAAALPRLPWEDREYNALIRELGATP